MSVVLLVLMLLLIAVNGLFVATEFAIVRSRRTRLEQLRDEGDRRAPLALEMIDHLGEPALAELLEPLFGDFLSHALALAISIAIAFTIVTFLHVILGEQSPKMV